MSDEMLLHKPIENHQQSLQMGHRSTNQGMDMFYYFWKCYKNKGIFNFGAFYKNSHLHVPIN